MLVPYISLAVQYLSYYMLIFSFRMIKAILIFNNHGKPRLNKFYQYYVSIRTSCVVRYRVVFRCSSVVHANYLFRAWLESNLYMFTYLLIGTVGRLFRALLSLKSKTNFMLSGMSLVFLCLKWTVFYVKIVGICSRFRFGKIVLVLDPEPDRFGSGSTTCVNLNSYISSESKSVSNFFTLSTFRVGSGAGSGIIWKVRAKFGINYPGYGTLNERVHIATFLTNTKEIFLNKGEYCTLTACLF